VTIPPPEFEVSPFVALDPSLNGINVPNDYVIEFYNSIVDTSLADTIGSRPRDIKPARPISFKIKNITADKYIDVTYDITGTVTTTHSIGLEKLLMRVLGERGG